MDTNTKMKQVLKLSDKDFKEGLINILQQSLLSPLEANEKWEKSQQKNVSYKKEPNGNYRT